jgi:hypothetical protein
MPVPVAFVSVLLATAATPTAADWLQMRDGSRIETRGPWEVRGAQVVFTMPNGRLASARSSEVDLEASARLTAEASAPKPAPPAPARPRAPVLVLTDEDLPRAAAGGLVQDPTTSQRESGAEAAAPAEAATPARSPAPATGGGPDPAAGLEVMTWASRYDSDSSSTALTGTLRNTADTIAFDAAVVASAFDGEGGLLAKSDATLTRTGLPPGGTSTFEVQYPGIVRIERAEFELSARRAQLQPFGEEPKPVATPAPTPVPGAVHLQIVRWDRDPEAGHDVLSVVGEISNPTSQAVHDVQVEARLLGDGGELLATRQALVAARSLAPGASTTFRATFPGIGEYSKIDFVARHRVTRGPAGG